MGHPAGVNKATASDVKELTKWRYWEGGGIGRRLLE